MPNFREIQARLTRSRRDGHRIGICLSTANEIVQTGIIDCNDVSDIQESTTYPHAYEVCFGGNTSPLYLPRTGPDAEEMLGKLRAELGTTHPVWHVIKGNTIVDVKVLSTEQNEALCQWLVEQRLRRSATITSTV